MHPAHLALALAACIPPGNVTGGPSLHDAGRVEAGGRDVVLGTPPHRDSRPIQHEILVPETPAPRIVVRDASVIDASVADDASVVDDVSVVRDDGPAPIPPTPPTIAGCDIFPADNPLNQSIENLPVHPDSDAFLSNMHSDYNLQPEFGEWSVHTVGVPINVGQNAPPIVMSWTMPWGVQESDPLPCVGQNGNFCYPIPSDARIEGGPSAPTDADRHLIYIDTAGAPSHCVLYELYNTQNWHGNAWRAANGAVFHLDTNALRPDGWTSADQAGLPVVAGLLRVDEVLAGEIRHAVRFTISDTANGFIHPATHGNGPGPASFPPMGLRLRLRRDLDTTSFSPAAVVIARAMQRYGIIVADTGPDWFITGDSDDRWRPLYDGVAAAFRQIHGRDFEVVLTGEARIVP